MTLTGHTFNFDEAKMIAISRRKGTRLVLESWLSDNKAVNRRIDIHPAFQALRHSKKEDQTDEKANKESDDQRMATKHSCNIWPHQ